MNEFENKKRFEVDLKTKDPTSELKPQEVKKKTEILDINSAYLSFIQPNSKNQRGNNTAQALNLL